MRCYRRAHLYGIGRGVHISVMRKMMFGEPGGGETSFFGKQTLFKDHLQRKRPWDRLAGAEIGNQVKSHFGLTINELS